MIMVAQNLLLFETHQSINQQALMLILLFPQFPVLPAPQIFLKGLTHHPVQAAPTPLA